MGLVKQGELEQQGLPTTHEALITLWLLKASEALGPDASSEQLIAWIDAHPECPASLQALKKKGE